MRPDRYPVDDAEAETFVRAYAETLYHPVGTCRMGADDVVGGRPGSCGYAAWPGCGSSTPR